MSESSYKALSYFILVKVSMHVPLPASSDVISFHIGSLPCLIIYVTSTKSRRSRQPVIGERHPPACYFLFIIIVFLDSKLHGSSYVLVTGDW